jgi:hypothetical protein
MNAYLKWIVGVAALAALAACSGGAPTTANPVTTVAAAAAYSGPPPATADVQAFMVNLWSNVKAVMSRVVSPRSSRAPTM